MKKAEERFQDWLHKNCKKGQTLTVQSSPTVFVATTRKTRKIPAKKAV